MDFQQWFDNIPKVTKYYLCGVVGVTFLLTYQIVPIAQYLILDYNMAIYKLQFWRLLTNFFIVGKFSFNFLFFGIMM